MLYPRLAFIELLSSPIFCIALIHPSDIFKCKLGAWMSKELLAGGKKWRVNEAISTWSAGGGMLCVEGICGCCGVGDESLHQTGDLRSRKKLSPRPGLLT